MKASRKHRVTGIYCIRNLTTNRVYVGKSSNIQHRIIQHTNRLRAGKSENPKLQKAWNKYGEDDFDYAVLEVCPYSVLPARELFWMRVLKSLDRVQGFNLRSDTDSGMLAHEETRRKISERLTHEWKQGKRSGHAAKLRASWQKRGPGARNEQSRRMSASLTRYMYKVNGYVVPYAILRSMGLANVVAKFHDSGLSKVPFKGHTIERVKLKI